MILKENAAITSRPNQVFSGGRIDESTLTAGLGDLQQWRRGWQDILDYQLLEWGREPSQLDDSEEGLTGPTKEIIALACTIACERRDQGIPPPLSVAPTGLGGIAMEWRVGPFNASLEIKADHAIEYLVFENGRLGIRQQVS